MEGSEPFVAFSGHYVSGIVLKCKLSNRGMVEVCFLCVSRSGEDTIGYRKALCKEEEHDHYPEHLICLGAYGDRTRSYIKESSVGFLLHLTVIDHCILI